MLRLSRFIITLLFLLLICGGVFLCFYQVRAEEENGRTVIRITPRSSANAKDDWLPLISFESGSSNKGGTLPIRIGTFNLHKLDQKNQQERGLCSRDLDNAIVQHVLIAGLVDMDLAAIQGLQGQDDTVIVRLVEQLNRYAKETGRPRRFDYAVAPWSQRGGEPFYNAFLFDKGKIDIDRNSLRRIETRDWFPQGSEGHLQSCPIAAMFRAKGAKPDKAFTFKMVNIHMPALIETARKGEAASQAYARGQLLDDVVKVARSGEPLGEDDVIIAGELDVGRESLDYLRQEMGVVACSPNLHGRKGGGANNDYLLIDRNATVEFMGRSEAVNIPSRVRAAKITPNQVNEVTLHCPVWAQFSPFEGGETEVLAKRATVATK